MQRSVKKLFLTAAIVAVVLALAVPVFAGSKKEEGAAPAEPESLEGVTINVLGVQDPWFFALEEAIPEFEKMTGITVNLEGLAWDALQARLTTGFITQQSDVDVISVDDCRLAQFAENGWIDPITGLIRQDKQEVEMDDFVPEIIYSSCTWRGKVYTLPIATYSQVVMYRTDLLKKAGLREPPTTFQEWWNWDTYMEYVRTLDDLGGDVYGTVIVGAQPVPIVHMYTGLEFNKGVRWFKQFPETPWDFTPTINTPKSVNALKYYIELYEHSPAEAINYLWFDAGTAFSQKDIGMFYWWSPYASLIRHAGYMVEEPSKNAGKYGYAVMPYEPGEPREYSLGAHGLGIPRYSGKKAAAWEFIKWATGRQGQKRMALMKLKAYHDFSRVSLFQDPELKEYYPWLDVQLYMARHSNGKVSRPHMVLYPSLEGFYGLQLNSALSGEVTPEEAMASAQKQFEVILKQNYYLPFEGQGYNDTLEATLELIDELSP